MIHVVNFHYAIPTGSKVVNTTSRSQGWSVGLSPFFLGPVNLYDGYVAQTVENAWQYSKLYSYYADENGNPTEYYFRWAEEGWKKKSADRYPMGREAKPLCSLWKGKKLDYITARKEIYIPLYSTAVQSTSAFQKLQNLYQSCLQQNITLYLQDFDSPSTPPPLDHWKLWENPNIKVGHAHVLAMMLDNYDLLNTMV